MPNPTFATLQLALGKLETNRRYKRLSPKRKKLIARMAQAYVNPDANEPKTVAKSMRKHRREQVKVAMNAIAGVLESVESRGAAALEGMSDVEWQMLTR